MYPAIIWWPPLSIIWWTPSHPNEISMNYSAMEWDIEKTISQHPLNSNSLILGLLKTRDIANLSKKGIHHMMYPVHHMMYPVHHMMNPPIHHMMDGVHHMMDRVHHRMDLHYIIYCIMSTGSMSRDLKCRAKAWKYVFKDDELKQVPSSLFTTITNLLKIAGNSSKDHSSNVLYLSVCSWWFKLSIV